MSEQDKLWSLITDNAVCMMVTEDGEGGLRARPMQAIAERDRGEIWFYTRVASGKSAEISEDAQVCLSFACPKKSDYVSVSGVAKLSTDREMIHRHWSRFVDAWFPEGPDGADVGMIRVSVERAEYWDGESSDVLSALKMLRASAQDETPDLGEHRKVAL